MIRNFEIIGEAIIGEACPNIELADPSFRDQHPSLPLSSAYNMRNALAHGYFKVDLSVVWNSVESDLPPFYEAARLVLRLLKSNDPSTA